VDKLTGMVKVSRRCLLDKNSADNLMTDMETIADRKDDEDTVAFPVTPPRPWNPQFFKTNVATEKK
jgi:hypothetical protein